MIPPCRFDTTQLISSADIQCALSVTQLPGLNISCSMFFSYISTVGPVQDPEHVDGRILDSGVAPDASDGEHAYLFAPVGIERHGEGDGVIHAGIRVNDELAHPDSNGVDPDGRGGGRAG